MLLLTPFNSKQWAYLNLYINRKFWRIGLFLQQKYYAIRKDVVKREIAINEIYWRCFRHSSILILLLHVCSTQLLKKKQDFLFLVCKHVFITNLSRKNGRHLKSAARLLVMSRIKLTAILLLNSLIYLWKLTAYQAKATPVCLPNTYLIFLVWNNHLASTRTNFLVFFYFSRPFLKHWSCWLHFLNWSEIGKNLKKRF